MKILMILSLSLLCGCNPTRVVPDMAVLKSGVEFEMQQGTPLKSKPNVSALLEWKFR